VREKKKMCIHGRIGKQRCRLCGLRSKCCKDFVVIDEQKNYACYQCGVICEVYQRKKDVFCLGIDTSLL
jgi:hypothetical protein